MGRPIHFEIHAARPERAQAFYSGLFGWTFTKWGDQSYWLIKTGDGAPGIDGGLVERRGAAPTAGQPVSSFVCTINVDDLEEAMKRGQSLGGAVALPRMAVPAVGWLGYLTDPEGNIFGLMQTDPQAR